MQPFREMPDVLGESERGEIRDLGRWRSRLRTGVLFVFAIAGLLPAGLGYWFAQELQFRYNHNVASLYVNVGGAVFAWIVVFSVGTWVSRRVEQRRMPAKIAQLAADYEIPVSEITKTTDLLADL
jgi:uncharacterized membrane protein